MEVIRKIEYGNYLQALVVRVTFVGGRTMDNEMNQYYTSRMFPGDDPMDHHGGFKLALKAAFDFGPVTCIPLISGALCDRAKEVYQETK